MPYVSYKTYKSHRTYSSPMSYKLSLARFLFLLLTTFYFIPTTTLASAPTSGLVGYWPREKSRGLAARLYFSRGWKFDPVKFRYRG